MNEKLIALIPARAGSERIKEKNFKYFCGSPLVLLSIVAAVTADLFHNIIVSTDDPERVRKLLDFITTNNNLRNEVKKRIKIHARSVNISGSKSPDCEWISDVFDSIGWNLYEHYMILRPTNPFRTHITMQRAWKEYHDKYNFAISMKSVQLVTQRPEKMWRVKMDTNKGNKAATKIHPVMQPLLPDLYEGRGYELQSSVFPSLYVQNGCIDICPVSIIRANRNSYIGEYISPFYTNEIEGLDINTQLDWEIAELIGRKLCGRKSQNVQTSQRVH